MELAKNAPLPLDVQRKNLEGYYGSFVPMTYGPVRRSFEDIFHLATLSLFPRRERITWADIEDRVVRACRSEMEQRNNVDWARALHAFAVDHRITGRDHLFDLLRMGAFKVAYWLDMVLDMDGRPTVVFIDPRRAEALDVDARQFVFSMMDVHIRQAQPDFAAVDLAILQRDGNEIVLRRPCPEQPLHSFDELQEMVTQTLRVWDAICLDREAKERASTASGGLSL